MNICPQLLHIRNSSKAVNTSLSDRITLEKSTSFGITELKSNISQKLDIQCLFCHEFKPSLCNEQWFNKDATVQICNTMCSNFHLCLQLNNNKCYVYFQKRSEIQNMDVDNILSELKVIDSINRDTTATDICVIMLLCGKPACATSIIAAKRNEFKNKFKIEKICFYMKEISVKSTILTFSENGINPCCINIEGA